MTDSMSSNMARPPPPPLDPNVEATAINEATQMENSVNEIQMVENRIRAPAEEREGDQPLQVADDERTSKEALHCHGHGDCVSEALVGRNDNQEIGNVGVQSMRRSVSMDSIICAAECEENSTMQLQNVESPHVEVGRKKDEDEGDGYASVIRLMRRPSVAQRLRLSPMAMKRSFSYGGRFFPSKHSQSLNSVLPM